MYEPCISEFPFSPLCKQNWNYSEQSHVSCFYFFTKNMNLKHFLKFTKYLLIKISLACITKNKEQLPPQILAVTTWKSQVCILTYFSTISILPYYCSAKNASKDCIVFYLINMPYFIRFPKFTKKFCHTEATLFPQIVLLEVE